MEENETEQPAAHAPCEHEVLHRARLSVAKLQGLLAGLTANCRGGDAATYADAVLSDVDEALDLLAEFIDDYDAADAAMPQPKAN